MDEESVLDKSLKVYLGEDILQGETEIPFYVLWSPMTKVKSIRIMYEGFSGISKYFNVENLAVESSTATGIIGGESIKANGYLGGLLRPLAVDDPYAKASLKIEVSFQDGTSITRSISRTIFTTRILSVSLPDSINLSKPVKHPIVLNLEGTSTVLIDIVENPESEVHLDLPEDVRKAFGDLSDDLFDAVEKLRQSYPQYYDLFALIQSVLDSEQRGSFSNLVKEFENAMEKAKCDKAFVEDLGSAIGGAIMFHLMDSGSAFYPIWEYFESRITMKAFLVAPLLIAKVPQGDSLLSLRVTLKDVLGNEAPNPFALNCRIKSQQEKEIRLKDLIEITRSEG